MYFKRAALTWATEDGKRMVRDEGFLSVSNDGDWMYPAGVRSIKLDISRILRLLMNSPVNFPALRSSYSADNLLLSHIVRKSLKIIASDT